MASTSSLLPSSLPLSRLSISSLSQQHNHLRLNTQLSFPLSFAALSLQTGRRQGSISIPQSGGTYNVQVVVEEDEPEERLLNRFRREVLRAGIIQECKRRRFFENSQEKRKRKHREAAKRNRRRRPRPKPMLQEKTKEEIQKKGNDDFDLDDDNWELPEVDVPYL